MEVHRLNATSRQLGDEHYRAMTDWVLSRAPADSKPSCRKLAVAYRKSLDQLIRTLEFMPQSEKVYNSLQFARVFRTLIDRDIELLDSH